MANRESIDLADFHFRAVVHQGHSLHVVLSPEGHTQARVELVAHPGWNYPVVWKRRIANCLSHGDAISLCESTDPIEE